MVTLIDHLYSHPLYVIGDSSQVKKNDCPIAGWILDNWKGERICEKDNRNVNG